MLAAWYLALLRSFRRQVGQCPPGGCHQPPGRRTPAGHQPAGASRCCRQAV